MAAGPWTKYNTFPEYMGNKVIDFDTDTFKVALFQSTSNAATATLSALAELTNQVANGNGYLTGGVTVTPTWSRSGATVTFDISDPSWTASGGSIVSRFAVLYDDSVSSPVVDALIAFCLLDTTPADVTITDGNTLTLQINASGVFNITGM